MDRFTFYVDKLVHVKKISTREIMTYISRDEFERIVMKMQRLIAPQGDSGMLLLLTDSMVELGDMLKKFKLIEKFLAKENVLEKVTRGKYLIKNRKTFSYDADQAWRLFAMCS